MAKSQWIVNRSEDGLLLAAKVKRKGSVYQCSAIQTLQGPEELVGTALLSLESSKSAVVVDEFLSVKDDILQLQIHNKLDQMALFNVGEKVSISYSMMESRRQKQLLSIIALPEILTSEGIDTITSDGKVELKGCVPAVAAIASLLQQLGPDPFITLVITRLSALLIGVRDGIPLFLQSIPLSSPAEVDSGVAAHAIGFGRQTLQRDFEIDSCRLVCLGEGRESFDFEALEEENWIPDWSHCLVAEGADIVLNPSLYGSLFVGSRFPLLPSDYVRAGRIKKMAGLLTTLAGLACLGLAILAYWNVKKMEPLQLQLKKEKRQLSQEARDVRRLLPEASTVARVKSYIRIMDQVAAEPTLASLLQDIAQVLPENVNFADLKIYREAVDDSIPGNDAAMAIPAPGGGAPNVDLPAGDSQPPAEKLLLQQIVISLDCNSEGEYSRVKARFNETVEGLSTRFSLRNVNWNYSEENGVGFFRCELMLTGDGK